MAMKKTMSTSTKPRKKKTNSDLAPGETRVPSTYKPFSQQNYDPSTIYPMTPADTLAHPSMSKAGYRIDLKRSQKIADSPSGSPKVYQEEYIKLPKTKVKKETVKKREEITARLPTKKVTTISGSSGTRDIIKSKSTPKKTGEKVEYTPLAKTKKLTTGGGRTGNLSTSVKNVVGKQVFKKEQKMSESYNRATKGAFGEGSQAGMNAAERRAELKQAKSDIKAYKKTATTKENKGAARAALKDTRKALKWSDKVSKGQNRYNRSSFIW